jgi:hypothetical protein
MPIQLSGSLVITGSITTTGGITISGSILSASYSDTASFSNNFRVLGDLTASTAVITGTLTAQTLVVQTVTSSIVYSSGSNIFGSALGDRQTFTGSVNITGSTSLNGVLTGTSAEFNGRVGINGAPSTTFGLESYGEGRFYQPLTNTTAYLRVENNRTRNAAVYTATTSGGFYAGVSIGTDTFNYQIYDGIAGSARLTISSTGAASFSSNVNIVDYSKVTGAGPWFSLFDTQTSSKNWAIRVGHDAVGDLAIRQSNSTAGDPVSAGTTRLYITSDGNVGIGTTTVGAKLQVAGTVEANVSLYRAVFGTTVQDADMSGITGGNGAEVQIQSASTTRGAFLSIGGGMAFGEDLGGIAFYNSNNVDGKRNRGFILCKQEGATAGEQGSYITFGTVANTVSVPSERMRITSGGNVGIGITNPAYTLSVKSGWIHNYGAQNASGFRYENEASGHVLNLNANNSYAQLYTGTTTALYFGSNNILSLGINTSGHVIAISDNAYTMGASGQRWSAIWSANGTIQTSDEREKKDITNTDLGLDFISNLRPVCYKWKVGQNVVTREPDGLDENGNEQFKIVKTPREGTRVHYGLIAQEVKQVLGNKDFGGYIHDEDTDIKGLRYDQFIAPLIKAIQELSAKVTALETK